MTTNHAKIRYLLASAFFVVLVILGTIPYNFFSNGRASALNTVSIIAPASNLKVVDSEPTELYLSWTASTDAAVPSYLVYEGGTEIGTSDSLTTGYLVNSLTPSTSYSFSVYAQVNNLNSVTSNTVSITTPSSSGETTTSSCGSTFSTGGVYLVTGSLGATNSICGMTFNNASNITLDCHGQTLNDMAIHFNSVNGFMVINCNFSNDNAGNIETTIDVLNTSNGVIQNNTFGNAQTEASEGIQDIDLETPTAININYNTVNEGYITSSLFGTGANGCIINHNNMSAYNSVAPSLQIDGSNNTIAYDTVDGQGGYTTPTGYQGTPYGMDDALILGENGVTSSNNLVEYNSFQNTFDMGIEFLGFNEYSTISYNNISNAATGGVGGWYNNSTLGNMFYGNTISNTTKMFLFFNQNGIPAGQSVDYFENNSFIGNDLSPGPYYTVVSLFYFQPQGAISSANMVTGNNLLADNNFSSSNAPAYETNAGTVDGGGNVCDSAGGASAFVTCNTDLVPTAPLNLTAAPLDSSDVFLSWTPSVEAGGSSLAGYNVYRNGVRLNATPITTTSFTDSFGAANTSYSYTVKAVDSSSIESVGSTTATVTTPVGPNPTVTITSPSNNGLVHGSAVLVNTIATPSSGNSISEAQLRVDTTSIQTVMSSPYDFTLNTLNYHDGQHTIMAEATDNLALTGTEAINLTITNGDFTGANSVGISDLAIMAAHWGQTDSNYSDGNITGQPTINISDLSVLAANWGTSW